MLTPGPTATGFVWGNNMSEKLVSEEIEELLDALTPFA